MVPNYCPRCGKPLLAGTVTCPFCGLDLFIPGPPGSAPPQSPPWSSAGVPPPPGARPSGWGVPQADQSAGKTAGIAGCLIIGLLLLFLVPMLMAALLLPPLFDQIRELPSFPADFPFFSFPP